MKSARLSGATAVPAAVAPYCAAAHAHGPEPGNPIRSWMGGFRSSRPSACARQTTRSRRTALRTGPGSEIAEAIRHQQGAGDWTEAARLLTDHALSLTLDGQAGTVAALLRSFRARDRRGHHGTGPGVRDRRPRSAPPRPGGRASGRGQGVRRHGNARPAVPAADVHRVAPCCRRGCAASWACSGHTRRQHDTFHRPKALHTNPDLRIKELAV
jgi:hypothetical protein